MKQILLSIDSGAPSWEATRLAVHIAPKLKVPITVISVVVPGSRRKEVKDQRLREYEALRELVDDVVKELIASGVEAKGEVRSSKRGEVDREILASATRIGADLIMLGSRARSGLTGLLFGSVSREIVRSASCPVVIVPTGAMTKVSPKRIVLAIDSRGDANWAVALTIELARAFKAAVEVVCLGGSARPPVETVMPASPPTPDEEVLAQSLITLEQAGVEVRARVIPDDRGLGPEIAQEAIATGADLIVIGTGAVDWIGEEVAARTAAAVARRTRRPVLVAPAPDPTEHSK
jgi:nucleotide-binding universal stress UspA family protein